MISKIFFFLIGFIFMVIGFSYIILYLNLISFGFSFSEYFSYILGRGECLILIIGFIIILIVVFRKGKRHVKRIRYRSKFIR